MSHTVPQKLNEIEAFARNINATRFRSGQIAKKETQRRRRRRNIRSEQL